MFHVALIDAGSPIAFDVLTGLLELGGCFKLRMASHGTRAGVVLSFERQCISSVLP